MSQTHVIQRVLRPALHRLQMAGVIPDAVDVDAVGMNTFRRGGETHARDRLQGGGVRRPGLLMRLGESVGW